MAASLVVIKSPTAFYAKAAVGDHLLQQNPRPFRQAWPVLGIILFDAQHHVQAHRIHEAEGAVPRTGGLAVDGIDHLRRRDTLGYHGQRYAFNGGPDAVEDKAHALAV